MSSPAVSGWYAFTHRIRWRIYAMLFGFGAIAYFEQKGMTVAAERIMPDLHLTQMQIGWLQWILILGYAAFQFPGGLLGQRIGARATFTLIMSVAFIATVLTPLAPMLLSGHGLYAALLVLQLIVGISHGAIFPVGSGVMEAWFHPRYWALIQGVQSLGLQFAAAATVPLVATLMQAFGWQRALLWPVLPAAVVIALWAWYARNTPAQHPSVTPQELAELGEARLQPPPSALSRGRLKRLICDRSMLLLTFSYVCMNYTYYLISNFCFLYLVQERHFSILQSAWLATVPPLAAGLGAGVGGKLVSMACERLGARRGFRRVPLIVLPCAGALAVLAMKVDNPYAAVAALAVVYFLIELTEGAYWGASMFVAREDCMAAGGVMNTGGNAGGLICVPIVSYLSGSGHWDACFVLAAVFGCAAALMWLGVNADQRAVGEPQAVEA